MKRDPVAVENQDGDANGLFENAVRRPRTERFLDSCVQNGTRRLDGDEVACSSNDFAPKNPSTLAFCCIN